MLLRGMLLPNTCPPVTSILQLCILCCTSTCNFGKNTHCPKHLLTHRDNSPDKRLAVAADSIPALAELRGCMLHQAPAQLPLPHPSRPLSPWELLPARGLKLPSAVEGAWRCHQPFGRLSSKFPAPCIHDVA